MIIWNFSTDKAYNAGDFCIYSGKLYKASVDVVAGAWDSSKWELIKTFQAAINVVTHDIADFWNSTTSYNPGDYCIYSNSLYKCLDSTTGAWDSIKWEQVNVMSQIRSGGGGISADIIAAAFDSTASYSSGDYVMYNDEFYKCSTATSGTWDSSNWILTDVGSELELGGGGSTISINPTYTSGIKIADYEIDGAASTLYIPSSGGSGSTVTITPTLSTGFKIAEYTIDGVGGDLYAPEGGGGSTLIADYDFTATTNPLIDKVRGLAATLSTSGATQSSAGVTISSSGGYIQLPIELLKYGRRFEIEIGDMTASLNYQHGRFFMYGTSIQMDKGFIYRSTGKWAVYSAKGWQEPPAGELTDDELFKNSKLTIEIDDDGFWKIYKDDTLLFSPSLSLNDINTNITNFGLGSGSTAYKSVVIKTFKVYKMNSGGGGGGTSDYEQLSNLPQINSVQLIGNKSLPDIGVDKVTNIDINNLFS